MCPRIGAGEYGLVIHALRSSHAIEPIKDHVGDVELAGEAAGIGRDYQRNSQLRLRYQGVRVSRERTCNEDFRVKAAVRIEDTRDRAFRELRFFYRMLHLFRIWAINARWTAPHPSGRAWVPRDLSEFVSNLIPRHHAMVVRPRACSFRLSVVRLSENGDLCYR